MGFRMFLLFSVLTINSNPSMARLLDDYEAPAPIDYSAEIARIKQGEWNSEIGGNPSEMASALVLIKSDAYAAKRKITQHCIENALRPLVESYIQSGYRITSIRTYPQQRVHGFEVRYYFTLEIKVAHVSKEVSEVEAGKISCLSGISRAN